MDAGLWLPHERASKAVDGESSRLQLLNRALSRAAHADTAATQGKCAAAKCE